jgi:hypothetical protein
MHNTIGRIAGKVDDYKICLDCGQINWYENLQCISCSSQWNEFREMTEQDGENLLKDYGDDEYEIDI